MPRVLGVDDFALRRRHRYATVLIDAESHERIDVLADRKAETLEAWLHDHPGVEIVCRDGSASYAGAIRQGAPLARLVRDFAQLMGERRGDDLDSWIADVRAAQLSEPAPFLTGLDQDREAVLAGLTLPYSNGPTEGVNTETKLLARQMYGRAGFPLLRHRILLG
ncbi:transposase [Streptomyces lunaelactis]|nr:transposase [Streptomyces lunaelactis]NUL06553.1 transposase [Streptomyces lunaelactis]